MTFIAELETTSGICQGWSGKPASQVKFTDENQRRGETAEVKRHGKTVAKIRRQTGASREEIVESLDSIKFTKEETEELKKAMAAASDVIGYAGRI